MLKKLVLIGGGGHCKSVIDSALAMNIYDEIVITDATIPAGSKVMGCDLAGTDEVLSGLRDKGFDHAFITVGSIKSATLRKELVKKANELGFEFPVICDPSANVSSYASIGEGTFIGKNAVINAEAKVGAHCIINTGAIVEHECMIGDLTHISVGTVVCGDCHIGSESFIGAGSTVIQCVNIGDNVIIGAGSTILHDLESDKSYCGVV